LLSLKFAWQNVILERSFRGINIAFTYIASCKHIQLYVGLKSGDLVLSVR
jgi:hypothetical protein